MHGMASHGGRYDGRGDRVVHCGVIREREEAASLVQREPDSDLGELLAQRQEECGGQVDGAQDRARVRGVFSARLCLNLEGSCSTHVCVCSVQKERET